MIRSRVQVVRYDRPPAHLGIGPAFRAFVFCTIDGKHLQPFIVLDDGDRGLFTVEVEQIGFPGYGMVDMTNGGQWLQFSDPSLTPKTRQLITDTILDYARSEKTKSREFEIVGFEHPVKSFRVTGDAFAVAHVRVGDARLAPIVIIQGPSGELFATTFDEVTMPDRTVHEMRELFPGTNMLDPSIPKDLRDRILDAVFARAERAKSKGGGRNGR